MSVKLDYLKKVKDSHSSVKVFLESGAGQPKTMLTGKIVAYDDSHIVLDECLIQQGRIISIAPYN